MPTFWYVQKRGEDSEPVAFSELVELVRAGEVTEDDLVRAAWRDEWQRADSVPGLFYMARRAAAGSEAGPEAEGDRPATETEESAAGRCGTPAQEEAPAGGAAGRALIEAGPSPKTSWTDLVFFLIPDRVIEWVVSRREGEAEEAEDAMEPADAAEAWCERLLESASEPVERPWSVEPAGSSVDGGMAPGRTGSETADRLARSPGGVSAPGAGVQEGPVQEPVAEVGTEAAGPAAVVGTERPEEADGGTDGSGPALPVGGPVSSGVGGVSGRAWSRTIEAALERIESRERRRGRLGRLWNVLGGGGLAGSSPVWLRHAFRWGCALAAANGVGWWLLRWSEREAQRFPPVDPRVIEWFFPVYGRCTETEFWVLVLDAMLLLGLAAYCVAWWLEQQTE